MATEQLSFQGLGPSDVVLRQDAAFGPSKVDTELWLSTLFLPLVMLVNGKTILVPDADAVVDGLNRLEIAARKDGVAALRTRVLSHVQPAPDLSILCSIRERLSNQGEVLASSSMTWTLTLLGSEWKISQIVFDDDALDSSVTGTVYLPD